MCCICTAGFISVSQKQEENKFLDSPVHGFNPPHEQVAPRDHLRTQVRRTKEEFPVQSETNDGRAEVPLILMLHSSCRHRCQCLQVSVFASEHFCCVIQKVFHCLSSCSWLSLFASEHFCCVIQKVFHYLSSCSWFCILKDGVWKWLMVGLLCGRLCTVSSAYTWCPRFIVWGILPPSSVLRPSPGFTYSVEKLGEAQNITFIVCVVKGMEKLLCEGTGLT